MGSPGPCTRPVQRPGLCPLQSPSRGPRDNAGRVRLLVTLLGWPLLSRCPGSESSRCPGSEVPASALHGQSQDISPRTGSEAAGATGQVGEPVLGSVLRPQPGTCYIPMGTMWSVGGPSFFFHSPPRAQTVRRNSSVLRSGLGPGHRGSRGWGSTHVPPERGRGGQRGSVSTAAVIVTMDLILPPHPSHALFSLSNPGVNCFSRNKWTILVDEP